jgi:enoyl-CoA hydratase
MGELVGYREAAGVAAITMDDGKVNALSMAMFDEVESALDRAEAAGVPVLLTGREGVFSAGFDLRVLRAGGPGAPALVRRGFELSARLLAFPAPVVVACTGHAVAMGVFLLLSGDFRLGAAGPYRITANEVAIGLTMPRSAIEICRQRLAPAHFSRAVILADVYGPDEAVAAGFLDRVVPPAELGPAAQAAAGQFGQLDMAAHAATKRRARQQTLDALRAAIEEDARALGGALAGSPAGTPAGTLAGS